MAVDAPDSRRPHTYWSHVGLILLATAAVYLVGNHAVPLWDRDEPRYAQTSRQMLHSGDWVVPRFLDDVRTAKPVFIYWCQAAAMSLFGDNAFAARVPSALAMVCTLALLALALPTAIGRTRAKWTVLILATSGLTIGAAKMCLTDAVLLLWVTVAQLCLYQILRGRGTWLVWTALGASIGLAGLTKGPVVLGVLGTTGAALLVLHWVDGLAPFRKPGLMTVAKLVWCGVIVCAICAPWLILIHRRAPDFLPTIIGHDVIQRARTGLEGHRGPPGYYLLTTWGTFFPWSLLLPGAIVYAWRYRAAPTVRFALAATVGPWVMFEIVQTKLPHYLLPVFPPLALLTARFLVRAIRQARRAVHTNRPTELTNRSFVVAAGIWAFLVMLVGLGPLVTTWLMPGESTTVLIIAVGVAVAAIEYGRLVFVSFRAGRPSHGAAAMGFGMLVMVALLYGLWLPRVPAIQTSPRVAAILREQGARAVGDSIMIDYKEPSLAFYTGGTIREQSNNRYLADEPPARWPRWIVITRRAFDALPRQVRLDLDIVENVPGWWYASKGKVVDVLVLRKRDEMPTTGPG